MKYEKETTIERLRDAVSGSYGAVVQYAQFVFVTDAHWKGGFDVAIYEFTEYPRTIESGLVQLKLSTERFEDSGSALAWCIDWARERGLSSRCYKTMHELTHDQFETLKHNLYWSDIQFAEIGGKCLNQVYDFPVDVPNEMVYAYFDGTLFTDEDFI